MDFMALLPLFELAANTTLTVLGGAGIVPANSATLAGALESAVLPLISSIQNKSTTTADVLAGYGALIGVLNSLRQNTSLPAATLAKVTEYISAAQDATTAYLLAQKGLDLSTLVPLDPIIPPSPQASPVTAVMTGTNITLIPGVAKS